MSANFSRRSIKLLYQSWKLYNLMYFSWSLCSWSLFILHGDKSFGEVACSNWKNFADVTFELKWCIFWGSIYLILPYWVRTNFKQIVSKDVQLRHSDDFWLCFCVQRSEPFDTWPWGGGRHGTCADNSSRYSDSDFEVLRLSIITFFWLKFRQFYQILTKTMIGSILKRFLSPQSEASKSHFFPVFFSCIL